MDPVTIVGLVVVLAATFITRIAFLRWQGQRTATKIILQFGDAGAITAERAKSLEQMGLPLRAPIIGLKDHRPAVLQEFIRTGILQGTEDGRFYLSPEAYRFYNLRRPAK